MSVLRHAVSTSLNKSVTVKARDVPASARLTCQIKHSKKQTRIIFVFFISTWENLYDKDLVTLLMLR